MSTWLHIAAYSLLGCVGMAIQDTVGVTLVKAIGAGRALLAGACDAAADIAKIAIMSISGVELTRFFGWRGYLGILPILFTGFFVTYHATRLSSKIVNVEDEAATDKQDERLDVLEQSVRALISGQGKS